MENFVILEVLVHSSKSSSTDKLNDTLNAS
jgi:hypothetical protein